MKKWLSGDVAWLAVALAVATSAGCGAQVPDGSGAFGRWNPGDHVSGAG